MANLIKVVMNKTTRTVTLLKGGTATPGGTVDAGTFTTRRNRVAMNFVQDLLYKLGYQDLQRITVRKGTGAAEPNLAA